jgi:glutamate-1-semialdehyde aminotransferase
MIALLRASGYTAQYVYGQMTIPGTNVANWLGVDVTLQTVGAVIASGGIPVSIYADATAIMNRVWVKATISGVDSTRRSKPTPPPAKSTWLPP